MEPEIDFTKVSEDRFTQDFLTPLFRAMGYRDVDYYHGGPSEQGKDLVMWRDDPVSSRENVGVVVKKGKINAKTTGSGSAGEVATQILQCFGDPFIDKRTGQETYVHRCFVVASGPINKDARKSITRMLKGHSLEKYITYLDGDEVKRLLEKYLPHVGMLEQMRRAHASVSSRYSDFELAVMTTARGQQISVQPKSTCQHSSVLSLKLRTRL